MKHKQCDSCMMRFTSELQIWKYKDYILCEDCYRRISGHNGWRSFKEPTEVFKEEMSPARYSQFLEFDELLTLMCDAVPGSERYKKYNLLLWDNLLQDKVS